MRRSRKAALTRYGTAVGICLVFAYVYLSGRVSGVAEFLELEKRMQYHLLCDAFSLPGFMLLLSGCMVALSNAGALDAIGYLGHILVNAFLPSRTGKVMQYFDYVQEKKEKRVKGYGFLNVVGGVFLAVSFVFLALYYSVQ